MRKDMSQKFAITCNNRYSVLSDMDSDVWSVWSAMEKEPCNELKARLNRSTSDGSGTSESLVLSQKKRLRLKRRYSTPNSPKLSFEANIKNVHIKHPEASRTMPNKDENCSTENLSQKQKEIKAGNNTQSCREKEITERSNRFSNITSGMFFFENSF